MAIIPVAPGEVAEIVTRLEMRTRAPLRPIPDSPLGLIEWVQPAPDKYRALFRRVGAPWLWFSRLAMDDQQLTAIIHDPDLAIFAVVDRAGIEVGLLELDYRGAGECEISFFGLVPELTGQGHGRWLMAEALQRAWRPGIALVWVHTCTLDHPSALNFYRAQGFVAVKRMIETFRDPRLSGLLPADAAPHIPLLDNRR